MGRIAGLLLGFCLAALSGVASAAAEPPRTLRRVITEPLPMFRCKRRTRPKAIQSETVACRRTLHYLAVDAYLHS